MKELKINQELRGFLPPLPSKDYEKLEAKIIAEGYRGTPIYTWDGYIVDGHHRYEICMKHDIEFQSEELIICDGATIVDYMEWMLNNQDARRNLTPADRLVAAEKLRRKIAEKARLKKVNASKKFYGNKFTQNVGFGTIEDPAINEQELPISTRKEIAKIACVGEGTVQRFDTVMKSGDEEVVKKVLNNEISINAGYKAVKEKREAKLREYNYKIKKSEEDTILSSVHKVYFDLNTVKAENPKENTEVLQNNVLNQIEILFNNFYIQTSGFIDEIEGNIDERSKEDYMSCLKNMSDKILDLTERTKKVRLKKVHGKEVKEINISWLESMTINRRPVAKDFIIEKSNDEVFDDNLVELVKISVRQNGHFKIIDGNNTIAICKNRGYKKILCELRYGLTLKEENDWFSLENTKSKHQPKKSIWTFRINGTYDKNMDQQNFNNTIEAIGYRLGLYGEKLGDGCINCIDTLFQIFKRTATQEFINIMSLHRSCFRGNNISLQANFLQGMFLFFETYKDKIDDKRFIMVFWKIDSKTLKKEAVSDVYTKNTPLKYAKVFAKYYNIRLSKQKQLKISVLED